MQNILFNFFSKNDICSYDDIIYIIKTKGTHITEFHLADKRIVTTYMPISQCKILLPQNIFLNINKGILINKNHIQCINRLTYHLKNGESFDGRVKDYKVHKQLAAQINPKNY